MKSSGTGQKGRQHAGVTANVDDDEKRRRAPGRQRRNKATQSLKATGGTCDYHDCVHDSWAGQRVRHDPLDLVETNLVAPAIVELRRARRGAVRRRRGFSSVPPFLR
jgi:hypothetical protein